jgi:chemotaxis response regulator CheB
MERKPYFLKVKEIIPDIIILDLNMPRVKELNFWGLNECLKYIPSIILTTQITGKMFWNATELELRAMC